MKRVRTILLKMVVIVIMVPVECLLLVLTFTRYDWLSLFLQLDFISILCFHLHNFFTVSSTLVPPCTQIQGWAYTFNNVSPSLHYSLNSDLLGIYMCQALFKCLR